VAFVLLAAAVIVGAAALILPRFGNDRRLHEVDRFHRAGQITSEWARSGVTQPVLVEDAAPDDDDAEPGLEDSHRSERERAATQA
jgi:hypothetical protein